MSLQVTFHFQTTPLSVATLAACPGVCRPNTPMIRGNSLRYHIGIPLCARQHTCSSLLPTREDSDGGAVDPSTGGPRPPIGVLEGFFVNNKKGSWESVCSVQSPSNPWWTSDGLTPLLEISVAGVLLLSMLYTSAARRHTIPAHAGWSASDPLP